MSENRCSNDMRGGGRHAWPITNRTLSTTVSFSGYNLAMEPAFGSDSRAVV